MSWENNSVSRRKFLAGAASAVAAPMIMRPARAAGRSNVVNLVTWGGTYQAGEVKTVLEPFTKETGIRVDIVGAPDLAKVKAQIETGNVEWDLIEIPGEWGATGAREGFWEKLDPSLFDLSDLAIKPTEYTVPMNIYVGGITWNPKRFGPGKHPRDFADYFDLKKFPGRRTFRKRAGETLEAALLGDGVAPKDIYPIDVNRAFKALDRIRSSIAAWVEATPQTSYLVQTGEVDFSYTYVNRVFATTQAGGGVPLAFSFAQNLIGKEDWAVLKGAPNRENAMKLITYAMRPDTQARLASIVKVGTVSRKANAMLTPEVRKWMPNLENPENLIINDEWWAENDAVVSRRFQEWLLG